MTISYVGNLIGSGSTASSGDAANTTAGVLDASFSAATKTVTVQSSPATFQANDLIAWAILVESNSNNNVSSVTDSRGNTYTLLPQIDDSSLTTNFAIAVAPMTTLLQAGDTLSVTLGSGIPMIGMPVVFRGAGTSLDGTVQGKTGGFGSAWTSNSVTTSAQPELGLCAASYGNVASVTDTPNAGWTDLCNVLGANCPRSLVFQYNVTAATGSLNAGGTWKVSGTATNESYANIFAVLQAASGGGGNPAWCPPPIAPFRAFF
ncbi:MAG: hypothetical protein ACTHMY_18085 [Solirubrobacteraceae bacterium]